MADTRYARATASRRSLRASFRQRLVTLTDEVPVDDFRHGGQIVNALALIIQAPGVLPGEKLNPNREQAMLMYFLLTTNAG